MFTLSKLERDNFSHLYAEIFWYGIFNGTSLTFWGVYIARLGANPFQVGLLSSGPGLVNLLLSLPAVYLLEKSYSERATFFSSILNRVVFILLIFLPWFHSSMTQIWIVVLIAFIASVPGTILMIGANLMLADVIPIEWRATVIGRRNALLSISITLSLLLSGVILVRVTYPINYQIVFGIGMLGAAIGCYHLGKVISLSRLKEIQLISAGQAAYMARGIAFFKEGMQSFLKAGSRNLLSSRPAAKPVWSIYRLIPGVLHDHGAPCPNLYVVPGGYDPCFRWGHQRGECFVLRRHDVAFLAPGAASAAGWATNEVLVYSAFAYTLYPLLGGLAQGPVVFYIASLFGGAAWGIANGALINRLFERTPEQDQPGSMALHNLVLNLGTMAGVLIGSGLAEWLGLRTSLILSGALRLVGAGVLVFWG